MRKRSWVLLVVGTVVALIMVTGLTVTAVTEAARAVRSHLVERASVRLATPLPPGDEFSAVNVVSQWPTDWNAAVCAGPLYELRIPYARLPHATAGAVCKARIQPEGEVPNITIARFPAELPMQIDLLNQGYRWYAFAFNQGGMIAYATFSEVSVADPCTNLAESPVLQPLKPFGFNIYASPGP